MGTPSEPERSGSGNPIPKKKQKVEKEAAVEAKKNTVRETIEIHPEKISEGTRYIVVCAISTRGQDLEADAVDEAVRNA